MPWTALVFDDLVKLQAYYHWKLNDLGDPRGDAASWVQLMCNFPSEWKELVSGFFEHGSMFDQRSSQDHNFLGRAMWDNFFCDLCPNSVGFKSQQALACHKRVVHKIRSPVEQYIGNTGICPVCHTNFHARPRLLCHLADKRVRKKKLYRNMQLHFVVWSVQTCASTGAC